MAIPIAGIAIAAAAAAALTIGGVQAGTASKKSAFDKSQKERLEDLERRKERGELGLTTQEQRLRSAQLIAPVQRAASQLQTRNEAALAGAGRVSGADLSRLRTESARTVAGGAQAARERVLSEDIARERGQEAELRQVEAAIEERRLGKRAEVFRALSQAVAVAGGVAGAAPATFRASGLAGAPISDPAALDTRLEASGASPQARQAVQQIPPQNLTRVLNNVLSGQNLDGAEEQALLQALTEAQAANPQGSVLPPGE